jgi:hypothetical protein
MWTYPELRSCWRRLIASGVALWLGLAQALPAQTPAKKYAVLVGINQYQHTRLPALSYAVNDVSGLSQLLEKAGYEVSLLCDATGKRDARLAPTKVNIEKYLKTILQKCRKGDTVFMAFAGHGLQFEGQKDSFFCPSDARPFADRTESLVSLGKIYEELDASFAAVKIMLVDACRNDPRGGRGTRGVDADSAPRPPRGVAALFSCSAGQTAYEDDRLKHGVFFHFVLQGLQGEAKDSDGEVTFDSLSSYVRKQVAREVPKMYGKDSQQSPNLKADLSGESPVLVRDDLQKVIDRAIKAHGADKDGKDKASTLKVKGTVHTMGMDLDYTGDYQIQEPDKFREVLSLNINGTALEVVTVFDGKKAWTRVMGNTIELGEDAIAAFKEQVYAGILTDLTVLKEKGYRLSGLAEKKIGDRPAVGVSVAREGHKDIFLYFDKETGMLLMSERQSKDPMSGQEYKEEARFSSYKEVDGVKRPHKVAIQRDGEKYVETEITELKILDKLDDSTFAKPDAIQKADEEIRKDVAPNQTPVDADDVLVINGSTETFSRECKGAVVNGSQNTITLTGKCRELTVNGSGNTIEVEEAARITIVGANNTVKWKKGEKPDVIILGKGSSVEKAE